MNPTTDRFSVRAVVVGLVIVTLGIVVALLVILITVTLTPEQQTSVLTTLGTIGTVALGGLVGVLAHTATSPDPLPPGPGEPINVPVLGGNVQVGPMPEPAPDVPADPVVEPLPPPFAEPGE